MFGASGATHARAGPSVLQLDEQALMQPRAATLTQDRTACA